MKLRLLITLAAALFALPAGAQRMPSFPEITGANVDPAADLLWLNDTSAGDNSGASKKIKIGELVNVPGFFGSVSKTELEYLNNVTGPIQGQIDGKLTNSMATGKLLGRGTAGTGTIEEITLGTNLSLSGTTLNAAGGGSVSNSSVNSAIQLNPAATRDSLGTQGIANGAQTLLSGYPLSKTVADIAVSIFTGSPAPLKIRQLLLGDSWAIGAHLTPIQPVREEGSWTIVESGIAGRQITDYTVCPWGAHTVLDAAGEIGTSTISLATMVKVSVVYSTVSGGGSFALEYSEDSGTTWTEIPGATTASPISTNNGGVRSAATFTYTFGTSKNRKIRAKYISGDSRILYFVYSDVGTTGIRGGSANHNFAIGGLVIPNYLTCADSIWQELLNVAAPTYCTFKSDDDYAIVSISSIYNKVSPLKTMDWIFLSSHKLAATPSFELTASDKILKDFALSVEEAFFDCRRAMPSHAKCQTLGLHRTGGDVHLTAAGDYYLSLMLGEAIKGRLTNAGAMSPNSIERAPRIFEASNNGGFSVNIPNAGYGPILGVSSMDNGNIANPLDGWDIRIPTTTRFIESYGANARRLYDNGRNIHVGGAWGFSYANNLATNWTRTPTGSHEFNGGQPVQNIPALVSATFVNHTGDSFAVYKDSSLSASGTRTAGIKSDGSADFTQLAVAPSVQIETATAAGSVGASGAGNALVTVTGTQITGSPLAINVAVANNDAPATWAPKVVTALNANSAVNTYYTATSSSDKIILTSKQDVGRDSTLNIALATGTATGITAAATSENTLSGRIPISASSAGTPGEIGFSSGYIYICTATNTWKRVAISTW